MGTSIRRVVVTGAASGIGAALAARLTAAGHDVVGVDRAEGAEVRCDLADAAAVDTAAARILAGGAPDGLALVAGVPGTAPAATVYAVNVLGLRRLAEALTPAMPSGSAIVLLASMAGYRGTLSEAEADALLDLPDAELAPALAALGLDGPEAYQVSKQLVHRHTLRLAARLHPAGVRCVSVSPGPVATPILADFRATMPSLDVAAEIVGRHARPEEIAAIADFALSPEASWLNGVDLRADGGLTALRQIPASQIPAVRS
ncbi:SDR family oxidoreductase [Pseudonocardia ailaonensis]|uniref:SDR family oxidoreductase n=1 Tax=Pseudonocardia ailaonensis TaxID=367279 RepID=A0ABN2NE36_9PSEU